MYHLQHVIYEVFLSIQYAYRRETYILYHHGTFTQPYIYIHMYKCRVAAILDLAKLQAFM